MVLAPYFRSIWLRNGWKAGTRQMTVDSRASGGSVRRLEGWLFFGLLGITLLVFVGVCGHEFVHFDDNTTIYNNPHIKGLTWENICWSFTNASYARRYMPLGWLSYAVDYQLFGLNPHAYHTGNLALHLINVGLLFLLLKRLLGLGRDSSSGETGAAPVWCAALGAFFWAVNPLRVETVAWASSRIYCVAFCFAMLALLAWLKSKDAALSSFQRRVFHVLSIAAYAASLLTYPLALFLPMVLFVLEVCPLRRVGSRLADWRTPEAWRIWREKMPFLAVGAGVLAITFVALFGTHTAYKPFTLQEFPPSSRGMQAFYIWGYYFWKPWAPYNLANSYMTLHSFNPLSPPFILSAVFVVSTTTGLFLLRRRLPGAFWLWVCHLVFLTPVLGLTEYPHSPYDRYSYLHGALWSVALAFGLRWLWRRRALGLCAGIVLSGATALFAFGAWEQVPVWRDTIPLYENMLAQAGEHPDRARFDTVLGAHYLRAGLTNEAIASFKNAIHYEPLRPDRYFFDEGVLPSAHAHLGDIYAQLGQLEDALAQYEAAATADPGAAWAFAKSGSTLCQLNRYEEALTWLREAARLKSANAENHHALAVALRKTGREEEARLQLEEERRLKGR